MSGQTQDKREGEEAGASVDRLDELQDAGDVEGLMALARAYRAGTDDIPKDLARCMDAYRAAASLGSAEAEYALALFHLTGAVVARDLEKGASHLRAAADRGSVSAKIYVANLYELGVYYARDSEKADVFYRSAARAADIRDIPTSAPYELKMADLGSVRHGLALAGRAASEEERARWMRKLRAYGYQLRPRNEAPRNHEAVETEERVAPVEAIAPPPVAEELPAAEQPREPKVEARPIVVQEAPRAGTFTAFLWASVAAGFAFIVGFVGHAHRAFLPDRIHQGVALAAIVFVLGFLVVRLSRGHPRSGRRR